MVTEAGVIAVILADGDPSVLLQPLAGHPLVAYCAAAAFQSQLVGKVVVVGDAVMLDAVRQVGRANGWPEDRVEGLMAQNPPLPPLGKGGQKVNSPSALPGKRGASLAGLADEGFEVAVILRPEWPVFTRGALDQAVGLLRQNLEVGRVVSLAPVLAANYWRPISRQGGEPTRGALRTQGQGASLVPAWDGGENADGGLAGAVYLETGHCEVIRLGETAAGWMATLPLILDPICGVSVLSPLGWEWLDWALKFGGGGLPRVDLVYPGKQPRPLPESVALLVMDFDGVLTDNRVWVDEGGHEQIAANRSDSLGLFYLRQAGISAMVISMETNPVVSARCRKLKVPVLQGINDKATILAQYLADHAIDPGQVVYLGNDVNDLPCFPLVGCGVAVSDSQPAVLRQADLVLTCRGGHAAVRELCDLLVERAGKRP